MMSQVREYYLQPARALVIYNGRSPELFDFQEEKQDAVLSVGRVWDSGKQVQMLLKREQAVPVWIAGPQDHPEKPGQVEPEVKARNVRFWGEQPQAALCGLFSRASIYAATSRYEPFGLAPVEAALSGCALVANDIPVFHELWGEAACYFTKDDPDALASAVRRLSGDRELLRQYARKACEVALSRFTAERMASQYEAIYQSVAAMAENLT
jgi:glycosyltransferase involved in cell wall biosynthesis